MLHCPIDCRLSAAGRGTGRQGIRPVNGRLSPCNGRDLQTGMLWAQEQVFKCNKYMVAWLHQSHIAVAVADQMDLLLVLFS